MDGLMSYIEERAFSYVLHPLIVQLPFPKKFTFKCDLAEEEMRN